jgi:hypothetical protein
MQALKAFQKAKSKVINYGKFQRYFFPENNCLIGNAPMPPASECIYFYFAIWQRV